MSASTSSNPLRSITSRSECFRTLIESLILEYKLPFIWCPDDLKNEDTWNWDKQVDKPWSEEKLLQELQAAIMPLPQVQKAESSNTRKSLNQRIAKRRACELPATLWDESRTPLIKLTCTDLSPSGIFLRTQLPIPLGWRCFVSLHLPQSLEEIRATAEAVRLIRPNPRGPGRKKQLEVGVGMKFLGLTQNEYRKIQEFIDAND